ncbi:hypothetical protein SAMN02745166_01530 [Prosthecobacter debontii]|uniref:Uncharacterized protein n=1 Tax=Prosthecobacter debontii TaxID=48467 RepID=A0A1T4XHN5_9BACT|nr:hypothetical protein [Prosthecobacter debontii]SKA89059.1 hypothetical protein SAMN02745166_01530 [Prosthecobacter debontii]
MPKSLPSVDQLTRALEVTRQIEKLQAELNSILGGNYKSVGKLPKAEKQGRKKREMSPEAKEKIAAAQRLRWARQKKAEKKG